MESNVCASSWIGYFFRLASINIVRVFLFLSCIPNDAYSESIVQQVAGEILTQAQIGNEAVVLQKFNELEITLRGSENSLTEGRKFLESFINELNIRYSLNLTISDACQLVRENLHLFQVSPEIANSLLAVTQVLEKEDPLLNSPHEEMNGWHIYPPWEWNWFGLNEKDKKKSHKSVPNGNIQFSQNGVPKNELPDELIIGAVETFAGLLLCIIPHPLTWGIGGAMVVDGVRRALDGSKEGNHQVITQGNKQAFSLDTDKIIRSLK